MCAYTDFYLLPDGWNIGERLKESEGYSDDSFPGCQYRLPAANGMYQLAVNIKITGRKSHYVRYGSGYRKRVQIELVGDGEPSKFWGGWLYSDHPDKLI